MPAPTTLSFQLDGFERTAAVYVPDQLQDPAPLVIVFHGGGGTGELALEAEHWRTTADREGFIAAAPDGLRTDVSRKATFLRNPQFWNIAAPFTDAHRRSVDDVAFTAALIDRLLETHPIDPARIYATGFSNGAAMTYRAGVALAPRLAAIAPVAGHLWQTERPAAPLPLLTIIGDADPLVPLEGGRLRSPWGHDFEAPPVLESVTNWARWHNCDHSVQTLQDDDSLRILRFGPCRHDAEIRAVIIAGGGHVWPGGNKVLHENIVGRDTGALNATETIWEFLAGKRRS